MKKIILTALVLGIAVIATNCTKKNIIEFDMSYSTDIVVPTTSMTPGQEIIFVTPDISTNVKEAFERNRTNSNLIGSIEMDTMIVSVKAPSSQSANFIYNMRVNINALNLPEQQVAYKYNTGKDTILPSQKTTGLHINDVNLKNRYTQNKIFFRIIMQPLYVPPASTITITHTVHVKGLD